MFDFVWYSLETFYPLTPSHPHQISFCYLLCLCHPPLSSPSLLQPVCWQNVCGTGWLGIKHQVTTPFSPSLSCPHHFLLLPPPPSPSLFSSLLLLWGCIFVCIYQWNFIIKFVFCCNIKICCFMADVNVSVHVLGTMQHSLCNLILTLCNQALCKYIYIFVFYFFPI